MKKGFNINNLQHCLVSLDSNFILHELNEQGIYFENGVKEFFNKVCILANPIIEYLNILAYDIRIKSRNNGDVWNVIRSNLDSNGFIKNIIVN